MNVFFPSPLHPTCLLVICIWILAEQVGFAGHPLEDWTWRNPPRARFRLFEITYGAGRYVGVGEKGTVAISVDGVNWLLPTPPTNRWLVDVTFDGQQFVAVGELGTILTSSNGEAWTRRAPPTSRSLSGVAWHDGLFVAVGEYGTLLTSPDAVTWTARDAGTPNSLGKVIYGNRFVAVGRGAIISSADGATWTAGTGTADHWFYDIAYANGRYVAAAAYGRFATSSNGVNWTVSTNRQSSYFGTMAAGNGFFVAVPDGVVHTSIDGIEWRARQRVTAGAITYGGDQFVIADGSTGATSPDGIRWTERYSASSDTLHTMAVHNDLMVVAGEKSFLTSTNGVDWVQRNPAPFHGSRDLIWADGKFVAVGNGGRIQTSTNGIDWVGRSSPVVEQLEGVAWGNGRFVAVGSLSKILVSSNGIAWQSLFPGGATWWRDVAYADGRFVAVGDHGRIAISTNGLDWTFRTVDYDEGYNAIAYGNGVWVAVGELSFTRYSTDLTNWFSADSALFYTVAWANGLFLAGGRDGHLRSSTNGIDWERRNGDFDYLFGITWHQGSFWGIGSGGMIEQSGFFTNTPPSIVHHPVGTATPAGTSVSLSGICLGSSPLNYQWTKDGTPLIGEKNSLIVLTNVQLTAAGNYRLIISNNSGSVTSDVAVVNITAPAAAAAQLAINLKGQREFTLSGRAGSAYRLSFTANLGASNDWTFLKTIRLSRVAPFEPFVWIDETATNAPKRFYRAEWIPE